MKRPIAITFLYKLLIISIIAQSNLQVNTSATDTLADAVAAAQTENQRTALLKNESQAVIAALPSALIAKGQRLLLAGKFGEASKVLDIAGEIAERSGNSAAVAKSLLVVGSSYYARGDYAKALDSLAKGFKIAQAQKLDDQTMVAKAALMLATINLSLSKTSSAMK